MFSPGERRKIGRDFLDRVCLLCTQNRQGNRQGKKIGA